MVKKLSELNPFGLRIPEDLKKQLNLSARKHQRSLNSEIRARLEASLTSHVDLRMVSTGDLVRELIDRNEPGRIVIEIFKPPE